MSDPQHVLAARVQAALGAAFGQSRRRRPGDPARRSSPTSRPTSRCRSPRSSGRTPRDVAAAIVDAPRRRRRLREPVEISGPGFINLTLRDDWIAGAGCQAMAGRRAARRRRVQRAAEHPDRLLRAQRRQGDARRAPAHDRRRRRARPHPGAPRPPRHPAEPHRRLGHAVRHAHRAPARRRRGLRRGRAARDRPERLLPGGPRASSTATRSSPHAGSRPRGSSRCRPATPTRCGSGTSSSTCPRSTSTGSTRRSTSR